MEVKEEKLMEEEQRVPEKTIPVFTVLKNSVILKNIFVVNSRDFSSPERNGSTVSDDDEEEEILVVGRHPDCDILLTHPSISRFHLEIRSISSRQRLFVTDLSSVHGTWVRDQRVEPHACVEVEEGDTIRIGSLTRIYRLHWIPCAYDFDNPFVSTVMEQEEENRMIDAENLEVAQHQCNLPLLESLVVMNGASPAHSLVSTTAVAGGGGSSGAAAGLEDFHFPPDIPSMQERKDEAMRVLKADLMAELDKEVKSLEEDSWMFEGPRSRIHLISRRGNFLKKEGEAMVKSSIVQLPR